MATVTGDRPSYVWSKLRFFAITLGTFISSHKRIQKFGARKHHYTTRPSRVIHLRRSLPLSRRCILDPRGSFSSLWALVLIVLLAYTAFISSYLVSFLDEEDENFQIISYAVDCLFFVDIIINLNSAYVSETGLKVTNRRKIFLNYLRSWLILDLCACIPLNLILTQREREEEYNKLLRLMRLPRIYRLLRLFRIFKLLRLRKSNKRVKRLVHFFDSRRNTFKLIKFGLCVIVLVHIVSCFWYLLAKIEDFSPGTWVFRVGLLDADNATLYITSAYWVFATLTTVGYGDITPFTFAERIFALILMVFGVAFYSYTISNLASILGSIDYRASALHGKLINLHDFAKATSLPEELIRRIRAHILINHEGNIASWFNQDDLLREIPGTLRVEVSLHMHHKIVDKIYFLQDKDPTFIASFVPKLDIVYVQEFDILYKEHQHPDQVYFLTRGRVALVAVNDKEFLKFIRGSYFGEVEIIENKPRICSAKIVSHDAEMLSLNRPLLLAIMKEYPSIAQEITDTAGQRSIEIDKAKKKILEKFPIFETRIPNRKVTSKSFVYPRKRKLTKNFTLKNERNRAMWKQAGQAGKWKKVAGTLLLPYFFLKNKNPLKQRDEDLQEEEIVVDHSKWIIVRNNLKLINQRAKVIKRCPLEITELKGQSGIDVALRARYFLKEYSKELSTKIDNLRSNFEELRSFYEEFNRKFINS